MLARDLKPVRKKIIRGIEIADQLGCGICGLGQYTSIVTRNGLALNRGRMGFTTGNALTAGMAFQALLLAAKKRGFILENSTVGVVGAGGNIGSVIAELLLDHCLSIKLIGSGRLGSTSRLLRIAHQICERAYTRTFREGLPPGGLLRDHAVFDIFKKFNSVYGGESNIGKFLYDEMLLRMGEYMPIKIGSQLNALKECELVITATYESKPILYPEHIRREGAVICDIGVPSDVHHSVHGIYPDVEVIRGGIVELPSHHDMQVPGNLLEPGHVFACIAETILLGLENYQGHYSYGSIRPEQVINILQVASKHGFRLAKPKFQRVF